MLPYPLSQTDEEEIKNLHGDVEVVRKSDLFTEELKELAKVTVYSPDALRKTSRKFRVAWETEVEYAKSYVYDHNLVFGASYTMSGDHFNFVNDISQELQKKFTRTFADVEAADPPKYSQIQRWFRLLRQPRALPNNVSLLLLKLLCIHKLTPHLGPSVKDPVD